MKIRVVITLVLATLSINSQAQLKKGIEYSSFFDTYYWRGPVSITGGLGLGAYSGDICSGLACAKLKPHYSIGVAYKVWPRVFVGAELSLFKLAATDKAPQRGFDFVTKSKELAIYGDFYLREDIVKRHSDLIKSHKLFKPYISAGLSIMHFSVDTKANEISGAKNAFMIPIGGGAFFDITHRIGVKVEGIYHLGFTDYLDGVSKLANPEVRDGYGTLRVKLVYTPYAKRMKPKVIPLSDEEKVKWSKYYSGDGDGEVAPKAPKEVDPEESDPYYNDSKDSGSGDTDSGNEEAGDSEDAEPDYGW